MPILQAGYYTYNTVLTSAAVRAAAVCPCIAFSLAINAMAFFCSSVLSPTRPAFSASSSSRRCCMDAMCSSSSPESSSSLSSSTSLSAADRLPPAEQTYIVDISNDVPQCMTSTLQSSLLIHQYIIQHDIGIAQYMTPLLHPYTIHTCITQVYHNTYHLYYTRILYIHASHRCITIHITSTTPLTCTSVISSLSTLSCFRDVPCSSFARLGVFLHRVSVNH